VHTGPYYLAQEGNNRNDFFGRPGLHPLFDMNPKIVLFLCTGNYYRSRFAEMMFNYLARRDRLDWEATSRGLALEFTVGNVGPISRHVLAGLNKRGIPLDRPERYPLPLDGSMLTCADHIVALNQDEHLPLLQKRFPQYLPRVEFWQVHDLDCAPPEEALAQIENGVLALIERLRNPQTA
jgi:protein-tyrosine phosphatase